MINYFEILFDDGNIVRTGMRATLKEAEEYYIGTVFHLQEEEPPTKGLKVIQLKGQLRGESK